MIPNYAVQYDTYFYRPLSFRVVPYMPFLKYGTNLSQNTLSHSFTVPYHTALRVPYQSVRIVSYRTELTEPYRTLPYRILPTLPYHTVSHHTWVGIETYLTSSHRTRQYSMSTVRSGKQRTVRYCKIWYGE